MRTVYRNPSSTSLKLDEFLYLIRGGHPRPECVSEVRWAALVKWYEKRRETMEPYEFPKPPGRYVDA